MKSDKLKKLLIKSKDFKAYGDPEKFQFKTLKRFFLDLPHFSKKDLNVISVIF